MDNAGAAGPDRILERVEDGLRKLQLSLTSGLDHKVHSTLQSKVDETPTPPVKQGTSPDPDAGVSRPGSGFQNHLGSVR